MSQIDPHYQSEADHFPQIIPVGLDMIVIKFSQTWSEKSNQRALALSQLLLAENLEGIEEVYTSLVSTGLRFHSDSYQVEDYLPIIEALLQTLNSGRELPLRPSSRQWRIPTCFDAQFAPDLPFLSEFTGLSRDQAIEEIASTPLQVQAIGFAPGQPYIGELPENWDIPRQKELNPHVPIGALAIAIRKIVLFTVPSATGWLHCGQTHFQGFNPHSAPVFPMAAGDRIAFEPVDIEKFHALKTSPLGGAQVTE